jgi:hypothetical protein
MDPHDQQALRDGDWKYLNTGGREYLFNLADDLGEKSDRSKLEPKRFAAMKAAYAAWNAGMLPYPAALQETGGPLPPPPGCTQRGRR